MSLGLLVTAALGAMTALTLNRMRRSRFRPRVLSTARFFLDEPRSEVRRRWVFCWPRWNDRGYQMQMAAMACLLLAVWLHELTSNSDDSLRVHVCVDVSGSMATRQAGVTRSQIGFELLSRIVDQIEGSSAAHRELRVSLFDSEAEELLPATSDSTRWRALKSEDFAARKLGTDLMSLRRWSKQPPPDNPAWRPTHWVVISDQPRPQWAEPDAELPLQWLDVADAVANHGVAAIEQRRDPLSGRVEFLSLKLRAYGPPPSQTRITVTRDAARVVHEQDVAWDANGVANVELSKLPAGNYRIELSGEDAWSDDNLVRLTIPDATQVKVDWRVSGQPLPQLLDWEASADHPRLVVAELPIRNAQFSPGLPLLIVGNGSRPIGPRPNLWFFCSLRQGSPLLESVNLDALEAHREAVSLPIHELLKGCGQPGRTENEWQCVLKDNNPGNPCLATLPAHGPWGAVVWMPVLPDLTRLAASSEELAWQTVFSNAVAWLLAEREVPLFELTSRAAPEPQFDVPPFRLALHPDEGDTSHQSVGSRDFEIQRRATPEEPAPWWQFPVLLALLLLVAERVMAFARLPVF
ncbi:MAG: hypothetical protein ACKV2Q_05780 [Planctomycetaceae bacterium]